MTYKQALDYLYSQLPMYQRQGKKAFKKDLKNIKSLCKYFDDPQDAYPTIHIAGTNGKGTVAHMLSAVFQQAGLRVGLYTSPHYKDFRERIKINGEYIPKRKVSSFTSKVKQQIESLRPSFFEITVAMAFQHFKNEKVDIAIIETGLGGRLDSTNIITPRLSIITNISLDHQSMLGNTLTKIAKEKAGIIKEKVSVVIGEKQKATTKVFANVAKKRGSKIYFAEDIVDDSKGNKGSTPLQNPYETMNARTVRAALAIWNEEKLGIRINKKTISQGIASYRSISNYLGRWQILSKAPLVIADSAHNEGGVSLLVNHLLCFYEPSRMHFVIGFVKDKPLARVLNILPKEARYYFCQAKIPRALPADSLKQEASSFGLVGESFMQTHNAFRAAKRNVATKDIVIVCGSIFVVAEVI